MKNTLKNYAPLLTEITLTDIKGNEYKAYMRDSKVMLAKSVKTGKFVKLSLVQKIYDFLESLKCALALFMCILSNVVGISFLALTSGGA